MINNFVNLLSSVITAFLNDHGVPLHMPKYLSIYHFEAWFGGLITMFTHSVLGVIFIWLDLKKHLYDTPICF